MEGQEVIPPLPSPSGDCRGCSGTCCTGVGSDPCACPENDEEDW